MLTADISILTTVQHNKNFKALSHQICLQMILKDAEGLLTAV